MMNKSDTGKFGESFVADYLAGKGYNIVARNFRIKGGEIDIIAENGSYMAFVEVKTRKPDSLVSGFEAVDRRKKGFIIRAASEYCRKNPTMLQPRFDVAQVVFDGSNVLDMDYIENAFDTTGYDFIF